MEEMPFTGKWRTGLCRPSALPPYTLPYPSLSGAFAVLHCGFRRFLCVSLVLVRRHTYCAQRGPRICGLLVALAMYRRRATTNGIGYGGDRRWAGRLDAGCGLCIFLS